MKGYKVGELRKHLSEALDGVERGETVIVERRGKRFRIVAEPAAAWQPQPTKVTILDPSLLDEGWSWQWTGADTPLEFRVADAPDSPVAITGRPRRART